MTTNFSGSQKTREAIQRQILIRWGAEEAARYNPYENCRPASQWHQLGYIIKRGESALKSVTIIEQDTKFGKKRFPKVISLFFDRQVQLANL